MSEYYTKYKPQI